MMKSQTLTALSGVALAILLSGCSSLGFGPKGVEYKSAQSGPSLEIPPDLAPPKHDDRFKTGTATLSGVNAQTRAAQLAGTGGVLPSVKGIRIERNGNERWLVIDDRAEDVYPRIREFWSSMNLNLVVDNPTVGVMETDWAENRARIPDDIIRNTIGKVLDQVWSSGTRDRYRTRVERGQNGTTEVFITHRGMEEKAYGMGSSTQTFRWEPRKPEPELEAEILSRLMQFLGTPKEQATELAQQATSTGSATTATGASPVAQSKVVMNGNIANLSLPDNFDRAWRRVGLALDRAGFTVVDRDRNAGTYYVRYADPEVIAKNEPGFLDKLKFWGSDTKEQVEQYRVIVKENAGQSQVSVLDKEGQAVGTEISNRIVNLLNDQLK